MADQTPMMKQYLSIKEKHQDAILFFRLGDFYEMFYDDAEKAARELDLVLTGRGKDANRMPMCGIPFHASDNYIARLIDKGYKVAICEQVEDPKEAKCIVKREVIRIVTPGTVIEANLLTAKANNYLLAITKEKNKYGLAYIDASTGEFRVTELESKEKVLDEVNRVNPAESIISDLIESEFSFHQPKSSFKDVFDPDAAEEKLKEFFKINSLDSFGLNTVKSSWGAAVAILEYLKEAQKTSLAQINQIKPYHPSQFMFIDSGTRRNLELVQTIRDKTYKGSLLWVLDRTKTSMGGRLLKQWILQPLLDVGSINQRLDSVEELHGSAMLRAEVGQQIKDIADIERAVGRIASGTANAKDLIALKESLKLLPKLKCQMTNVKCQMLKQIHELSDFGEVLDLISRAIVDDPPFVIKEGGLIKINYDPDLDEIKKAAREGKDWIAHLENEERKRTGIKSLKVGFTRVFGYYIEVTKSNLSQVPDNYIRKQTLVNAERFITPELKEK
ncbi:MAG: DNA mismatch repair protein MutS, partial [Candidatus Margulisiibacteriota bacterium]